MKTPTLYDHAGRPVRKAELQKEPLGPTLSGIRQTFSGHPEAGLTPGRLAMLMRAAENGYAGDYLDLAEAVEERYLRYQSVLGVRKRAVSQLEISVEAAADDAESRRTAELVESWVRREDLSDEIVDCLDAIGKGYSETEIIWDFSEKQWWPKRLEHKDPRWFEFDRTFRRELMIRAEGGRLEPIPPYKFVSHRYKAKTGLPIRGGLTRGAAWAWLFVSYSLKDWLVFAEVYGQPFRLGKYPPGATREEKEVLRQAVSGMSSDLGVMIPEAMLLELVETSGGGRRGGEVYERMVRYWDSTIAILVLGQNLTTEVSGGSYAAAKTHDDVRADIRRADARALEITFNRDLVRPLIDLNFGPRRSYPRVRIGTDDEWSTDKVESITRLVDRGLRVGQETVRRRMGIPEPEEDAELLRPESGQAKPSDLQFARGEPSDPLSEAVAEIEAEGLSDWEQQVDPILEPIRTLARTAGSYAEFQEQLPGLLEEMDSHELIRRLATAALKARGRGDSTDA